MGRGHGWNHRYTVTFCDVQMRAKSSVSKSVYDELKQLGLKEIPRNRATRSSSEAVEKTSCWFWFNLNERENKLLQ